MVLKCDDDKLGNLGTLELENDFTHLILSPGPGSVYQNKDIGHSAIVLQKIKGLIPILGVCLGHQLMGAHCGAKIIKTQPQHGKKDQMLINYHDGLFKGMPNDIEGIRYHSMIIDPQDAILMQKEGWIISSYSKTDQSIMAMEHLAYKWYGLQFHPESVGTAFGREILGNFLKTS